MGQYQSESTKVFSVILNVFNVVSSNWGTKGNLWFCCDISHDKQENAELSAACKCENPKGAFLESEHERLLG